MFKLDAVTGEISETSTEQAIDSLRRYGWKLESFTGLQRGAVVLFTADSYFCRFKDRLDEMAPDVVQKPIPAPAVAELNQWPISEVSQCIH